MQFMLNFICLAISFTIASSFVRNLRIGNSQTKLKFGTKLFSGKSLIIWDCDGVLVDSEALLKQGEVEALAGIVHS